MFQPDFIHTQIYISLKKTNEITMIQKSRQIVKVQKLKCKNELICCDFGKQDSLLEQMAHELGMRF